MPRTETDFQHVIGGSEVELVNRLIDSLTIDLKKESGEPAEEAF